MKKLLAIASATILLVLVVFTIISCIKPVTDWGKPTAEILPVPCDFTFRMNEIECLRKGVNPFDVWHADIEMAPYYPNNRPDLRREGFTEPINAYAPWEYTLMMPLSFLPRKVAWGVYLCFMFFCLYIMIAFGYMTGKKLRNDIWDGVFCATVPVMLLYYPIWSNFCIGNLMVPVIAALVGMLWCLDRKYDVLAGLCWALASVKPQAVILFVIPLLWRRKFVTCLVAAGTCLLLSIPPAVLCKTSIVTLILQTPAANTFGFYGCGTFPYFICTGPGDIYGIAMGLIIGIVVCVVMTWLIRKEPDWVVFVAPTAVCSMCWTYVQVYSHALGWFFVLILFVVGVRESRMSAVLAFILSATPFLGRLYMAAYKLITTIGCFQVANEYVNYTHYVVDTVWSTMSLLLALGFFVFASNRKGRLEFNSKR